MLLPDPKYLDVFRWPLKISASVAIASSILLALSLNGFLDLGSLGALAKPVLIIVSVIFVVQFLVGSAYELLAPWREKRKAKFITARREVSRREEAERVATARANAISGLDHLSKQELAEVAKCLRAGSPSFYTYALAPSVALLQAKGLVWTPGGTHHQDHYPFSFHSFVWEVLLARKEEFLAKDEEHQRADRVREAQRLRRF
jgi:hypothetical protein